MHVDVIFVSCSDVCWWTISATVVNHQWKLQRATVTMCECTRGVFIISERAAHPYRSRCRGTFTCENALHGLNAVFGIYLNTEHVSEWMTACFPCCSGEEPISLVPWCRHKEGVFWQPCGSRGKFAKARRSTKWTCSYSPSHRGSNCKEAKQHSHFTNTTDWNAVVWEYNDCSFTACMHTLYIPLSNLELWLSYLVWDK